MGSGKSILDGVFKFAASEARKKFDRTDSSDQGEIGERTGRNQGVIGEKIQGAGRSEEVSA